MNLGALVLGLCFCTALGTGILIESRLVWNATASEPVGLYWESPLPAKPHIGQFVLACLSPQGARFALRAHLQIAHSNSSRCPAHFVPLLKTIAALPGDRITVHADGDYRNGIRIPDSRPLHRIATGARLPQPHDARIAADQAWLLGAAPNSYDSRYLGPLHPFAAVTPLLVRKRISP